MLPGPIESAIVIEPLARSPGGRSYGGWSIVDDERKKPHEAIVLPLEPLVTNEASVLRISMHHTSDFKFKSLIGRFRISYTQDDRIRELMLPVQSMLWSSIGPFPAQDVAKAYATAFEPEKDIKGEPLDLKKSYTKVVLPPVNKDGTEKPTGRDPGKPAGDKNTGKKEGLPPDKGARAGPAARSVPLPGAAPATETPCPEGCRRGREEGERSRRCGRGELAKPEPTGKPGPAGGQESKGIAVGPAAKPDSEAKKRARGRRSPKPRRP